MFLCDAKEERNISEGESKIRYLRYWNERIQKGDGWIMQYLFNVLSQTNFYVNILSLKQLNIITTYSNTHTSQICFVFRAILFNRIHIINCILIISIGTAVADNIKVEEIYKKFREKNMSNKKNVKTKQRSAKYHYIKLYLFFVN